MVDDLSASLDAELRGLDALDTPIVETVGRGRRLWSAAWPKMLAAAIILGGWQIVVWSEWRDVTVLPGPATVLADLGSMLTTSVFWEAIAVTMQRIATGFALATAVGLAVGMAVARSSLLRRAIGSIITGLQAMPSIVWFPFAILVFGLSEAAILFVVVLGAAPAIANGLIVGIDHIPPVLLRAARVLGARGSAAWRYVIIPAALPAFVAGLKQGWAFAWRSLIAGELLVGIASRPSIGVHLDSARRMADSSALLAMMLVVLLIGILVDSVVFGTLERRIRHNRGVATNGAAALH